MIGEIPTLISFYVLERIVEGRQGGFAAIATEKRSRATTKQTAAHP
jgi:hypothetical protein